MGAEGGLVQYFTVYGGRGHENHAVIAMIARALIRQDPFQVWGTGEQIRNWTHVIDIVEGTLFAAERIDDGTAVNLGTTERTRVIDAVREVLRIANYSPRTELLPHMPTGPLNRVAANGLAKRLFGWEPKVMFRDGLAQTYTWHASTHDPREVRPILQKRLTGR